MNCVQNSLYHNAFNICADLVCFTLLCITVARPSLRGACPLDVAYSSLMDNNELALALRESDLDKVSTICISINTSVTYSWYKYLMKRLWSKNVTVTRSLVIHIE